MYIVRSERGTLNSKKLWTFILWSYYFMISSSLIQSVYCHTVVCRHGFFHKAGAHTFTNHFQKSVSVYDMYFLSYVWFFSLFLSLHGFCKYLCVCKDIFANVCQNIFDFAFNSFSNFSCMFLNPKIFFRFEL